MRVHQLGVDYFLEALLQRAEPRDVALCLVPRASYPEQAALTHAEQALLNQDRCRLRGFGTCKLHSNCCAAFAM